LKNLSLLLGCLILLAACSNPPETSMPIPAQPGSPTANAAAPVTPSPTAGEIVVNDPFVQNRRLGRGVNLGNALEAPSEGEWGVTLEAEYFKLIKSAGFDSVRIPIRWNAHAAEDAPYTISPAFFERVDWAIDQALSQGLLVVINIHHYDQAFASENPQTQRFLALWEQIAARYQTYPDELLFELLNEPHDIAPEVWNTLLAEVIPLVRATNPHRNLVVGPVDWYGLGRLFDLQLPADDHNLIVSFHYYQPFQFTHQGAEWVEGSDPWLGTTWQGIQGEKQAIKSDFSLAVGWAEKNHRPLYLGEFGAYSKAEIESRARWTDYIARLAEENGMSWAYWEFCAGFGVYDREEMAWNQPLLQALLPDTPLFP